ncbi:hypothetical protein AURDEDRAFT_114795, partial [Auricularia subglabra TFB-10046 SS5]
MPAQWASFQRTALENPSTLPVINLSMLVRPPPPGDEFAAVVKALKRLRNVQMALALLPQLESASVRRLYVSKHGPPPTSLPTTLRLPKITHLYFEPYYNALYPLPTRALLPAIFPSLTHFGMTYVPSSDEVSRDLRGLTRTMLALPHMERAYIRVLASTLDCAESDAEQMADSFRSSLCDSRVHVGYATTGEWFCPLCTQPVYSAKSLWTLDAIGRRNMWTHGRAVGPCNDD